MSLNAIQALWPGGQDSARSRTGAAALSAVVTDGRRLLMPANWRQIASAIGTAAEMERKWIGAVPQEEAERELYTPWMPFQLFTWIAMLAEAAPDVPQSDDRPPCLMEIGAGIATKLLIAREVFGLDVHGIERSDEYAAVGRTLGLDVVTADALSMPGYGGHELLWFNRAFRDTALQAKLEALVWNTADPGAVIMCANLECRPPMGWYPILDAWSSERHGIWQKPFGPGAS